MACARWLFPLSILTAVGCARTPLPDARVAAVAFAAAVERKDVDALFNLLNEASRHAVTKAELAQLLATAYPELQVRAQGFAGTDAEVTAAARVLYANGRVGTLSLEHGEFRIRTLDSLPAGARSPVEALAQLRGALARRSYASLVRTMSKQTQAALEEHVTSLVQALDNPDSLELTVDGDSATAKTRSGHRVELKQEGGVWTIQDFE
jgi:hypothetical protein